MNNSDMPAMPVTDSNGPFMQPAGPSVGLTKREHFAAMAMQGLLSNPNLVHYSGTDDKADRVRDMAVNYADGLLKALEESK